MDVTTNRQLVCAVVKFLHDQLSDSNSKLSEEGRESIEVAIQCLETAYNVSQNSAELSVPFSLCDIFISALKEKKSDVEISLSSQPISTEDKAEAERLKNDGNQLMREEKYIEALQCYTRAVSLDGTNAVFYCNRAAAYSKINNHNEAIADCQRALQIEPNYSKAYGRMGLAYSSLNDFEKARDCYKKALEIEPNNESYVANLEVSEEKLKHVPQPSNNAFSNLGGILGGISGIGGSGSPDLSQLLSNPSLMNMATQLMSDPNMQNMMANLLGNATGGVSSQPTENVGSTADGSSMEALLSAGRQLAEQMQAQHPQLVEQLRAQMNRNNGSTNEDGNPPPNSSGSS